jgi:predicted metalloendopeptidase
MLQIKSKENFKILREPIDRKAWGASPPTVVNAFYTPSKNQISKFCFLIRSILYFFIQFSFSSGNSSNAIF